MYVCSFFCVVYFCFCLYLLLWRGKSSNNSVCVCFCLEENVKICYLSIDKIENDSKWLIGFALQTRTQTRSFLCLFVVVNLEFSLDLFVSYILDQCQSSFEAPMNIDHYNGTYCAILSISHVFNTRIRKHFWLICNAWVCTKLNTNTDEEKMCVSCVVVVIMHAL